MQQALLVCYIQTELTWFTQFSLFPRNNNCCFRIIALFTSMYLLSAAEVVHMFFPTLYSVCPLLHPHMSTPYSWGPAGRAHTRWYRWHIHTVCVYVCVYVRCFNRRWWMGSDKQNTAVSRVQEHCQLSEFFLRVCTFYMRSYIRTPSRILLIHHNFCLSIFL